MLKKNATNPWRYYMYLKMNKIKKLKEKNNVEMKIVAPKDKEH